MAYKTKTRKTRKNRKGGKLLGPNDTQSVKTVKNNTEKQRESPGANVPCKLLDTQYPGKLNPIWDTCTTANKMQNHILYITPNNVIIKSIESVQIPEFNVKIDNVPTARKIMIEDKYVSCFLYISGNWYAIMRLLGKTLNTEFLARTEKNRAFFKLSGIHIDIDTDNPNNGSGLISIPSKQYTTIDKKHILSTSKTPVIQLTPDSFTNIDKKSLVNNEKVFNVLQRFRQTKLLGNAAKQTAVSEVAYQVIDGL